MIIGNIKYEELGLNSKGESKNLPNVDNNVKTAKETMDFLGI